MVMKPHAASSYYAVLPLTLIITQSVSTTPHAIQLTVTNIIGKYSFNTPSYQLCITLNIRA